MGWKIKFYDDAVMESIYAWPPGIRVKFLQLAELIEEMSPREVGMPHIKAFGQGLFEIRAKGKEGIGRAFFCMKKEQIVIVLNGFIKKTQQTPQREIEIARKRMKEVKSNE